MSPLSSRRLAECFAAGVGIISAAILVACGAPRSELLATSTDRAVRAEFDALVRALQDTARAPALSVAVARQGAIVLAAAVGMADLEAGRPATSRTMYRIGSVSKLFTAAAAARLAERGVLDLDADVRRYVPEFSGARATVTSRQLAGHLGGIRHYGRGEFVNRARHDSVAAAVAYFQNDTLLFEPGARYGYSSFGYVLLSLAIERAAGASFLAVLRREVLAPLNLDETAPDLADSVIPNRARTYDLARDSIVPAVADDLSNRWAAGGLLSSVLDLTRFGSAHLENEFLRDSTISAMTQPQLLASGSASPVGIGWRIGTDEAGRRIWHHSGSSVGGRATLVVWPDEGIVVAVAGNLDFPLSERVAFRFAALVR